jgi:hypothetical protein
LKVGSSNFNNRSMRLDTECDVVIDATLPGNKGCADQITAIRNDLLAEHLGCAPADVAVAVHRYGSLIKAIDSLATGGRLRGYVVPDLAGIEKWLADNEVLDPEGPGEMFEGLTARGLFRGFGLFPAPG